MKKTVMVIAVIAIIVLMAEPNVIAQAGRMANQDRPGATMGRGTGTMGHGYLMLKEELGLTDEQLDKIQALRLQGQKEMILIKADLQLKKLEMVELMKSQGNDDAVKAKSAEMQAIMNQMAAMRTSHQLSHRAVFTAEQWEKVSKLRGMMSSKRGHGNRDSMRGHRSSSRGGRMSSGKSGRMHSRGFRR